MSALAFTVFETALGWCALAWSEAGIARGWLPAGNEAEIRTAVARRCPDASEAAPPPFVAETIGAVKALMAGEAADLSAIPLDEAAIPELHQRIYAIARAIPASQVLTYGEVAERLGDKALAREVGRALGLNPFPPIVPCHRIVAAGGASGGFSAPGGVSTKMRLLNVERARLTDAPALFDDLPLAVKP